MMLAIFFVINLSSIRLLEQTTDSHTVILATVLKRKPNASKQTRSETSVSTCLSSWGGTFVRT